MLTGLRTLSLARGIEISRHHALDRIVLHQHRESEVGLFKIGRLTPTSQFARQSVGLKGRLNCLLVSGWSLTFGLSASIYYAPRSLCGYAWRPAGELLFIKTQTRWNGSICKPCLILTLGILIPQCSYGALVNMRVVVFQSNSNVLKLNPVCTKLRSSKQQF